MWSGGKYKADIPRSRFRQDVGVHVPCTCSVERDGYNRRLRRWPSSR